MFYRSKLQDPDKNNKYLLSTAGGGGVGVRVHGGPVIFQSGADAVRMKQR